MPKEHGRERNKPQVVGPIPAGATISEDAVFGLIVAVAILVAGFAAVELLARL